MKQTMQHIDPMGIKALASGMTTISFFGFTITLEEVTYWTTILSDLGVLAGGIVTVILGIQGYRNAKKNNK